MEKIILGKTNLEIGRMGFGGIPIQRADVQTTREILLKLRENGGNYIDSARNYTVSESYIGQAIEDMRDDFVLASKSMATDYETMKRDINISLTNFRTDYIDLYQIHNPSLEALDKITSKDGALAALMEARQQHKIGHIGITAHSKEVFEKAIDLPWVETIMFPFNIVENQGLELIRKCKERNIGFIDMKPLAGGAIENTHLALRYIASFDEVSVIIPGMASVNEIDENLQAIEDDSPLSKDEQAEIEKIKKRLGNNFCRRCNYCAPCSVGIDIPMVFLLSGYLQRYGLGKWANDRYQAQAVKADQCIQCGLCETRCPYHLPIREMLKQSDHDFKAYQAKEG